MIHRIDHKKGKPDGWAGLAYMTAVVILAKVSSTYWKPNKPLTSTSVIGGKKIALISKPLLFHFFLVHPNVQHNQVEPPKKCFTDFFFFSLLLLCTWDKGSRGSNTSRQKLQSLEMTNHLLLQGLYYPLCKRNRINWHNSRIKRTGWQIWQTEHQVPLPSHWRSIRMWHLLKIQWAEILLFGCSVTVPIMEIRRSILFGSP